MNYEVGVEPPSGGTRFKWGEYIKVVDENQGQWVEFTFDDPKSGYRFYHRMKNQALAREKYGASVRDKGAKVSVIRHKGVDEV